MYVVYVLYSPSFNKTYTGFTSDMDARLLSHNFLATKGHTIKYRPWVVVYMEKFELKRDAMKREKELKSGRGREYIRKIIEERGV